MTAMLNPQGVHSLDLVLMCYTRWRCIKVLNIVKPKNSTCV